MDYSKDMFARYLAMRVRQHELDDKMGLSYDAAITSTKTTQAAVDWWMEQIRKED